MLSNLNRRRFLRTAAGVLVPAGFAIGQSLRNPAFVARLTSAGSAAKDSVAGSTTSTSARIANRSDYSDTYNSSRFTASSSYTVASCVARLLKAGTPTFNLKCAIYTHNSTVPGTLVGTPSNAVASSNLSTSEGDLTFSGMSASLTNGTQYWVVIYNSDAATYSSTNYVKWASVTLSGYHFYRSANASAWSFDISNERGKFTLYT